ncbi:uncharacterized protein [Haliotis asinina]|uniref:uncharacterized protein n=1 Tax=Haliotis asinina TaxID=109174 RepID=UPI0035327522
MRELVRSLPEHLSCSRANSTNKKYDYGCKAWKKWALAHGFMRSSELLAITRNDVVFCQANMAVFIQKSKTDVYRDEAWIIIGRTGKNMCPVAWLERYLKLTKVKDPEFVFRNMSKTKNGYILRADNKPMSYSRLRELFIEAFSSHVSDISKFGLHSLRAGGATAAANNGIPDRMFKRHGRWKSENAKDGYVKDDIEKRLKVFLSLGLPMTGTVEWDGHVQTGEPLEYVSHRGAFAMEWSNM